jgi:predicted lipid-binding transport protein (Tim44 family)
MRTRAFLLIFGLSLVSLLLLDTASVWARATSGGSRGSRSSSSPSSPSTTTTPSSPSRTTTPDSSQPMQQSAQRPGMFGGGLMGGLAGFALGGLLGSMLFGGMGGGFGGGIGLLEILLIGGALFLVFRMLRGRADARPEPAYAGAYGSADRGWSAGGGTVMEAPPGESDLDRGVSHIRSMDATFDPAGFADWAKGTFADVQAGIAGRDLGAVQDRLTPQEFGRLQAQCDQLRGARRTNRIERVQIGRAEVTEAWQESGQDWVTVYFAVSLVDYTVDDSSGAVVEGATTPVDIQEYWTFTRPVGPKPWRLSAIQTA